MRDFNFPGWRLLGSFPDGEPDDVGSWLLHHGGEACLLEFPEGLDLTLADEALRETSSLIKYATASHFHEDHFSQEAWMKLQEEPHGRLLPSARFINPARLYSSLSETILSLGGEPLYLIHAPKHSCYDTVVVFRGVAMTGDIELGTLKSVNAEVSLSMKRKSMQYLAGFCSRHDYHVHTIVSAHLNDLRRDVCWEFLFAF
jgi:glyoxylase-like metal-dependent hydrolase (beta-lactamase superfamily II)